MGETQRVVAVRHACLKPKGKQTGSLPPAMRLFLVLCEENDTKEFPNYYAEVGLPEIHWWVPVDRENFIWPPPIK